MAGQMFGVGSPGSASGASGGKFLSYNNISTAPQVVAAANPNRVRISFWNPHASITMFIAPSQVMIIGQSAPVTLTPSVANLGGCIPLFAGNRIEFTGECQGSFQAFSASGSALPLTVIDSNVPGS